MVARKVESLECRSADWRADWKVVMRGRCLVGEWVGELVESMAVLSDGYLVDWTVD